MIRLALCLLISLIATLPLAAANDAMMEAVHHIDQVLHASWDRQQLVPNGPAGDAEFLRRLWLDLAGVAPPVDEARRFLRDSSADKRTGMIDRLLKSSLHANHLATRWTDILLPVESANAIAGSNRSATLHRWLRQQFRKNTPYDHLVGSFLTAGGEGNRGPAIFYTSRSLDPTKIATATSKVFLGIQLQCAQCHDHPFADWTQQDFWQYTAFFSQLTQTDAAMAGREIITDRVGGEVTLPDSDDVVQPRYPGVAKPPEPDPQNIRRRQLTIWLASRDNPYFARAAVNRAWHHLFGRGLVEPIDEMERKNAATHPELLDFLANYFTEQRFDLRRLYATLTRTKAYGLSSAVADGQSVPADSFAAMTVKTMSAAQFYDSLQRNVWRTSMPTSMEPNDAYAIQRIQFLTRMRGSIDSPRDYPHGVVQVLGIMNGPELVAATDAKQFGLLAALEAPFMSDVERIEAIFLATLSRLPSDNESADFLNYLAHAGGAADHEARDPQPLADLLWVLLNTAECTVIP